VSRLTELSVELLTRSPVPSVVWRAATICASAAALLVPAEGNVEGAGPDSCSTPGGGVPQYSTSVFPILMYDSDIGFGFGGKVVTRNRLRWGESFDIVLFGSTGGEQWYALGFSIPDPEIRLGTAYPVALDLRIEYDKYLKSNFFGFGNDSEDNERQSPKETARLEIVTGRALARPLVAEVGFAINHTSVYAHGGEGSVLAAGVPGAGECLTSYLTVRLRWDSRDSHVHPSSGTRLCLCADRASKSLGGDFDFRRYRGELSTYMAVLTAKDVLAARLWLQHVEGTAPYYERSIVGGGWTARGFKADRFIDDAMTLVSAEYRFPISGGVGGVLFADTGRVCRSLAAASLRGWKVDGGCGLRYYLRDFVVRFDAGISEEGLRVFFNFGHVF
jgi:outer membrane protein assembly factor BamA